MSYAKALAPAALALSAWLVCASAALAQDKPKITADVVYGHKDGMALVMHALQPPQAKGSAVLFIVSGGYYSPWAPANAQLPVVQPFLKRGHTVFCVFHGSNPRYNVVEIVGDVRRAVRFIRANAGEFGVDPQRLGAIGGSAGGHLTLMLATTGDDGDASATDPILKAGSRIAAAVALAPPVDLRDPDKILAAALERGGTNQAGVDSLKPAFTYPASAGESVSPVLHVTSDDAPTLLIHGDVDKLVPIDNGQHILAEFQKQKVSAELLTLPGVGHGPDPASVIAMQKSLERAGAWFDQYLAAPARP